MLKPAKIPQFDNLEDVNTKFVSTICYFKGKPVYVKAAEPKVDPNGHYIPHKFVISVQEYMGKAKTIDLDDPEFNYKTFNLGYANTSQCASWWYRVPLKQYRQGLKQDQLHRICSEPFNHEIDDFSLSPIFIAMLENKYPSIYDIQPLLRTTEIRCLAFHKDFAISWDNIHEDYVLEYRGKKVGVSLDKTLKHYRLMEEYSYVKEALAEAIV